MSVKIAVRDRLKNRLLGWPGALKTLREMLSLWWKGETQSRGNHATPQGEVGLEEVPIGNKETANRLQSVEEGCGWLYHRSYGVEIVNPKVEPEELIRRMRRDPNRFCAVEWMKFEKRKGEKGKFCVGDEFQILIRSPWNGPVRVIEIQPLSFRFATMEGHLEAGEICFSFEKRKGGGYFFCIESWSRSKDTWVDLMYDKLQLAKVLQSHVWAYYCKRVVEESEGEAEGPIIIETEKLELKEDKK